jgi:site-specific recombinase XerC
VRQIGRHEASGVKQQLAAMRMLFDCLVTGQVVPMNPAAAVRGPKHVVKTEGGQCSIPLNGVASSRASPPKLCRIDLRDRALIATLSPILLRGFARRSE